MLKPSTSSRSSEAREGEKLEPPAELRDAFEESQLTSAIRFLDLTEPRLNTAR